MSSDDTDQSSLNSLEFLCLSCTTCSTATIPIPRIWQDGLESSPFHIHIKDYRSWICAKNESSSYHFLQKFWSKRGFYNLHSFPLVWILASRTEYPVWLRHLRCPFVGQPSCPPVDWTLLSELLSEYSQFFIDMCFNWKVNPNPNHYSIYLFISCNSYSQ